MAIKQYTYDELAKALGIKRVSAERLTRVKRWKRTRGNDGKARVEVSVEDIKAHKQQADARNGNRGRIPQVTPQAVAPTLAPDDAPDAWRVHVELAETRATLAAERERRSALEADIARLQDAAGRSEADWRDRFEKVAGDLSDARAEAAGQRARADALDAESRRGLLARMFGR